MPARAFSAAASTASGAFPGVTRLAWGADGKHLVSAHMDHAVRVWATDHGFREACPALCGHTQVTSVSDVCIPRIPYNTPETRTWLMN
eukprot:533858-Prorocentrum_minimum.AAC.3